MRKFLEKDLQDIKISFDKEKINVFLVTLITSVIAHFQLYALEITGPDTLINSMYHSADIWESTLLRFGLEFVQMIKGNIVSPILATFISIILLGITTILIIDILEIKNKYFKYIIAILFAVAPNISATLTFFYCSDSYMLGLLLSTLTVYIMKKYKQNSWIILLSGLLISLAMSMYQTYLSVTMVLCIADLIIGVINKVETKEIIKSLFEYLLMGIVGILLYSSLSHLILILKKLPVNEYSGANQIGLATLLRLPELLPEAYQSFFNYYFNDKIIPNTIWNTHILYITIFLTIAVSMIYIIVKNKLYSKKANIVILFILIVLAPVCFGIIEIMVPDVNIHILMACSMIYIFPIFFKILEMLPKSKMSNAFKYIVLLSSLGVIWNYIWQDNASYTAIKAMQNQAESVATRIVTQIEELDEYTPEMPVIFFGALERNPYFDRKNTSLEAGKLYDRTWGFICNNATVWNSNVDSWRKLLYEYTGSNLNLVKSSKNVEILYTEEYWTMKKYPEKDSIKIINDTVIVKLSD